MEQVVRKVVGRKVLVAAVKRIAFADTTKIDLKLRYSKLNTVVVVDDDFALGGSKGNFSRMRLRERTTLTTTTTRRTGKIVCCTRAVCSMMILPRPSSRKILRTW